MRADLGVGDAGAALAVAAPGAGGAGLASGEVLLGSLAALALSLAWSAYRHGSVAWGAVVWAFALAATAGTLLAGVPAPHWHGLLLAAPHGGVLLAGFLAVAWSLLGAGVAERHGQGRGLQRLVRTGLIFALGMAAISLGWLSHLEGPAADLAFWELRGLPVILLSLWVFTRVVRVVRAPAGSRPVCGWTMLNSLCGYGVFASGCLQAPPLALIALCCGRRRVAVVRGCTRIWMHLVYGLTPTVRWRCRGELGALAGRRIVVANHESMLDILSASALPGVRNLLAKTWVFRAPALGLGARFAGIHNVDALSVDAYLSDPQRLLGTQEGLFIFPEGRRTRSGLIGRFHLGAFHLAIASDAAVVPVAMCGSSWSLPPQLIWIHPGELQSVVLPPVPRLEAESARAYSERVRRLLAQAVLRGRRPLVACAFNRLNRRGWQLGRPRSQRRAAAQEDREVQAALVAVAAPGAWLQLGAGAGAACVLMRQLVPAAVVTVVEPSRAARARLGSLGLAAELVRKSLPVEQPPARVLALWDDAVLVCAALAALKPTQLVVVRREMVAQVQVVLTYRTDGRSWVLEDFGAFAVLRHPELEASSPDEEPEAVRCADTPCGPE